MVRANDVEDIALSKHNKEWRAVLADSYRWPFVVEDIDEDNERYNKVVPLKCIPVALTHQNFYDCLAQLFKIKKSSYSQYTTAEAVM
jgi:hypothetical protein